MPKARTLRELIVDLHRVVMGNGTDGLVKQVKDLREDFQDYKDTHIETCPIAEEVKQACLDLKDLKQSMVNEKIAELQSKLEGEEDREKGRKSFYRRLWPGQCLFSRLRRSQTTTSDRRKDG